MIDNTINDEKTFVGGGKDVIFAVLARGARSIIYQEQEFIGYSVKRELAKVNYCIHMDATPKNFVTDVVTRLRVNIIYASEIDVLISEEI